MKVPGLSPVTSLLSTAPSELVPEVPSIPQPGLSSRMRAFATGFCSRRMLVCSGSLAWAILQSNFSLACQSLIAQTENDVSFVFTSFRYSDLFHGPTRYRKRSVIWPVSAVAARFPLGVPVDSTEAAEARGHASAIAEEARARTAR